MKLSKKTKKQIIDEYNNWVDSQYGDKSLEERKQLDAFFTPPEITIQMLELYDTSTLNNITIYDPACGTGNLLVACIIAGADPSKVYGVDIDEQFIQLCRARLSKYNVPPENIIVGDSLTIHKSPTYKHKELW